LIRTVDNRLSSIQSSTDELRTTLDERMTAARDNVLATDERCRQLCERVTDAIADEARERVQSIEVRA